MAGVPGHGQASEAVSGGFARPWLDHYQPGVPHDVDLSELGSVADLFRDAVARHGDRPALESFGVRISFAELGQAADAVASWLQQRNVGRGDRVALILPNVMAYGPLLFGTLLAGAVVVSVNPLYTPRELVQQLRDSGARVVFVLENFGHTLEAAWHGLTLDHVVIVSPGDCLGLKGRVVDFVSRHVRRGVPAFSIPGAIRFAAVLARGREVSPRSVALAPDDLAFLQYTGGTTGVPKGAALSHRNIRANLAQLEAWIAPSFAGVSGHVMVTALPLYHVFALTVCAMLMLRLGGCQVLIANPRDIPGLIAAMRSSRFTLFAGVNTLYAALAAHPGLATIDFSRVRLCVAGGMALHPATAKRWRELTGTVIVEGYGLSETSPLVCSNRVDLVGVSGTVGYPVPSTEIALRGPEGTEVPVGQPGELCVRGPQVMTGYWQRPEETARAMTADGFFRTGDVAVLEPDGQVRIVDRIKDMILVSGFNVYPSEVEEVLCDHPGIREAAVIGLPDAHLGEAVIAVVAAQDAALTEGEILAWCRRFLVGYKVPRRIAFRASLPKSPVGKILRRLVREEMLADAAGSPLG